VAAAIKLTPLVFVLWYLIDGDRRAAARAVLTTVAVTLAGVVLAPAESLEYWTRQLFRLDSQLSVWSSGNQNLRPIAASFGLDPRLTTVVWLALALLALGLAVFAAHRCARRGDPLLGFLAISAGGLLASPISWSHHWVWLLPVLPVLAHSGMRALAGSGLAIFTIGTHVVLIGLLGDERGWAPWLHALAAAPVIWAVVLLVVLAAGRATTGCRRSVIRRSAPDLPTVLNPCLRRSIP
jgi:alpha-1,2-mannosyltransferase